MSENPAGGGAETTDLFSTNDAVELYTRRFAESDELFPQERKAVDRYFEAGGTVLDVGCGVGRVSALLHERGFEVTGVDISEPFIEKARLLVPDVEFHVADITDTEFDTGSFDHVVFSWFGLDYLVPEAKRIEALTEIRRILKPSGVFLFCTHNRWHPLVPLSVRNLGLGLKDIYDLYLRKRNRSRLFSRCKAESVTLGEMEIYLTDPIDQWIQLRKCGLTPIDIIGERKGILRFFERDPHYVAKK